MSGSRYFAKIGNPVSALEEVLGVHIHVCDHCLCATCDRISHDRYPQDIEDHGCNHCDYAQCLDGECIVKCRYYKHSDWRKE